MAHRLDDEEREEYTEAFQLHDKNKDGRMTARELQECFRYLGTIYSDGEIMDLVREAGGADSIDQNQFMGLVGNKMSSESSLDDVLKAFQVFDKDGNGMVAISELRYIMTCLGDKLDDDMVDEMLNTANPSGTGAVSYESFARSVIK